MTEYPGSIAFQVSRERLAGRIVLRDRTVMVGTTPVHVLANNPRRIGAVIVNHSTDAISVGIRANMTFMDGIILAPNGGTLSLHVLEDGETVGWDFFAVGQTTGGTVFILEQVGG